MHAAFIQKQTYSRKKTILKYIHRWLPSGSKSFGQNLGCNYCEGDGEHHDHDHFITCAFSIGRKEERIQTITNKLNVLLTPPDVSEGIINGIWSFYNNTMEINETQAKNKAISEQTRIGWEHFCRGRVSKKLTESMENHYANHPDNPNFTGKDWIKQMIALMITIHVEEWYLRCHNLTSTDADDNRFSPEKRSLFLTIKLFCEKIGSLPLSLQKWFSHSEEEYQKMPVQSLKQWIKNTKRLFKIHTKKSNERKITEFFPNIDGQINTIGNKNPISKSDKPTTKNYDTNNTYLRKDGNNYSEATHYEVSKYFKQIENSDSAEAIYQFGENSTVSDNISAVKTNNITETRKASQFFTTTYSGTTNIPATKNNTNYSNKNKNNSKKNEINLDKNYNKDNDSTGKYTDTTNSNSKNEHIQKYKQGGKILYTGEINSKYNSGSCRKSISQALTKKQKKDKTTYSEKTNTVTISTKNMKPRFQKIIQKTIPQNMSI